MSQEAASGETTEEASVATEAGTLTEAPRRSSALGRGDSVGRYLLLDKVGRGAMGEVFSAHDPDLDRHVAIKLVASRLGVRTRRRERVFREAQAMARIDHPHVVAVHDVGIHEETLFIAMEIVDGPSLDRWLTDTERTQAEILDVFVQAAQGLAAAHAAGVVHADFKPANVLVAPDRGAKVGDFGLAGFEEGERVEPARPRVRGTPGYMSPEHFAGGEVDARSDQFSYCIALAEALYGGRPFEARSLPELAGRVSRAEFTERFAASSGRLAKVLRRGLQPLPRDRFASMEALRLAIERARRPRWPWFVLATGAVGLVAAVTVGSPEATPECKPGTSRVAEFWTPQTLADAKPRVTDLLPVAAEREKARLVDGIAAYADRWIAAYDASCAATASQTGTVTPVQRTVALCLEDRLAAFRGLVGSLRERGFDPKAVHGLLDSLPDVAKCQDGGWEPSPSDPATSQQAQELLAEFRDLERERVSDTGEDLLPRSSALVADARQLGDAYRLAMVLCQRARLRARAGEFTDADADIDQAVSLALTANLDTTVVHAVNEALMAVYYADGETRRATLRLSGMARALAKRAGATDRLRGDLAMNEGNLLRSLGRYDEASAALDRAKVHFDRNGAVAPSIRLAVNRLTLLSAEGKLAGALDEVADLLRNAQEVLGPLSREADALGSLLIIGLHRSGRLREAFASSKAKLETQRSTYKSHSATTRRAANMVVLLAVTVGAFEEAESLLSFLEQYPEDRATLPIAAIRATILAQTGHTHEGATALDELRARPEPWPTKVGWWLEVERARLHYVHGEIDRAHALLGDREALERLKSIGRMNDLVETAILALTIGAPNPAGTSWSELADHEGQPSVSQRKAYEAAQAVQRGDIDEVRRARDSLAMMHHDRETRVLVLDRWLATR